MVLPIGVLASEFSVEAKDIIELIFFQNVKGGPKGMKILNEVPP